MKTAKIIFFAFAFLLLINTAFAATAPAGAGGPSPADIEKMKQEGMKQGELEKQRGIEQGMREKEAGIGTGTAEKSKGMAAGELEKQKGIAAGEAEKQKGLAEAERAKAAAMGSGGGMGGGGGGPSAEEIAKYEEEGRRKQAEGEALGLKKQAEGEELGRRKQLEGEAFGKQKEAEGEAFGKQKQAEMEALGKQKEKEAMEAFLENNNVNLGDYLKEAGNKIELKTDNGKLTANGAELGEIEKTLELKMNGGMVEINPKTDRIMISEGGINVESQELVVEGDKMVIGDVEIKKPSEVIKKDELGENVKKISIKEEDGRAVYSVEREMGRKLFGLIPVGVSEKQKLDAVNGDELGVEKPWWGFMAR